MVPRIAAARAATEPEERALRHRAAAARLGIGRVVTRADVVELHVEDERRRAVALLERRRIGRFDREHVEEAPEHRVHRQERDRHAAAPAEELPPAQSQSRRQV